MKKNNRIIISLGGSLIVPSEIDVKFLKAFKNLIEKRVLKGDKFILITGGGKTSRRYSEAAKELGELNPVDLDWLGIHSTRLNGHLMRTIFRKFAYPEIITNPFDNRKIEAKIIIAAGYHPGWSTDYDAVLLAKNSKAKIVLNLSNIDYVYDKNPKLHTNAKPFHKMTWRQFRKLVGNKWDPGLNAPFDPVASKLAEKLKLQVIVMNGKDIKNLKSFFDGKEFKGTIIS